MRIKPTHDWQMSYTHVTEVQVQRSFAEKKCRLTKTKEKQSLIFTFGPVFLFSLS